MQHCHHSQRACELFLADRGREKRREHLRQRLRAIIGNTRVSADSDGHAELGQYPRATRHVRARGRTRQPLRAELF